MDRAEILSRIHMLNLPAGEFIVCGGAPLAMADLRDADDIDLFVTPGLYEKLERTGWRPYTKPDSNIEGIVYDTFEAHKQWRFNEYDASFTEQLAKADFIEDIPFLNLAETRAWKLASGRPKDLADIQLIDLQLS